MSFFDSAYAGIPPWDIGRPQAEVVKLEVTGEIRGDVLDVGCGTGENLLFLVGRGHDGTGIDLSPRAIEKAQLKAKNRQLVAKFVVGDALDLAKLSRPFDSTVDCGLFHTFSNGMRRGFTKSLKSVLKPGGTYFMLCFSEDEPEGWGGPRRVTQREIRETFAEGWRINYIRKARFDVNSPEIEGNAWLSSITRVEDSQVWHD